MDPIKSSGSLNLPGYFLGLCSKNRNSQMISVLMVSVALFLLAIAIGVPVLMVTGLFNAKKQ